MDTLFVVGIALLFYAVLLFEGISPGGAPVAVIVACVGILVLLSVIRSCWRDRNILALVLIFGVLSYLGYVAGQGYFGW